MLHFRDMAVAGRGAAPEAVADPVPGDRETVPRRPGHGPPAEAVPGGPVRNR